MLTIDKPLTTQPRAVETPPSVNHYVRRDRILRSIVEGVPVRAACGERFVVEARGGGRTHDATGIICPACEALYERMAP